MNRKIILLTLLLSCLSLLGCGREFDHAYDDTSFDAQEILSGEIAGIRAKGFASDLCVVGEGESETEGINAASYGMFAVDDQEVKSCKNVFDRVYPASTTKIMTCLLAIELCDPEELVTVPQESKIEIAGSSMADLAVGDQLTMREMLYALMVPSGNDAAAAIAVHISGSIEDFAKLMNQRARQLGATQTNFVNPHGLPDENHYTTVYDMYLIFNQAIKSDLFRLVSSTPSYTTTVKNSLDQTEREVTWTSGNGFYNQKYTLPGGLSYIAGKTGHTNAAGFCLVLGETDTEGKNYISIIMNATIYEYLYDGMIRLTSKFT